MSHRIHNTEAFVLGGTPVGEGSSFVRFYTREFGLISAWVQGVRDLKSKLRYHVQPYSHSVISLVRGRDMWRVTGAESIAPLVRYREEQERFHFVSKVFVLLSRLLAGEEGDTELFDEIRTGIVRGVRDARREELPMLELVLALRVLFRLGYIADDGRLATVLMSSLSDESLYTEVEKMRPHAISIINQALRESHL